MEDLSVRPDESVEGWQNTDDINDVKNELLALLGKAPEKEVVESVEPEKSTEEVPVKEESVEKIAKTEEKPRTATEEPVSSASEEVPSRHLSLDEWKEAGKDPDLWKGKKAWDKDREAIEEKRAQAKELRKLQEEFTKMKENLSNKDRLEAQKQLETLERKKTDAKLRSDFNTYEQTLNEIQQIRGTTVESPVSIDEETPDFKQTCDIESRKFVNHNADWWNLPSTESKAMTQLAIATEKSLRGTQKGLTPDQIYDRVQKTVKAAYPHRFTDDTREYKAATTRSSREESGIKSSPTSPGHTKSSSSATSVSNIKLSDMEEKIFLRMKTVDPDLKKADFLKDIGRI